MERATEPRHSNAQTAPAAANSSASSEPAPVPVRSAKDAINAMYAREGGKRLSDYLASSTKDIINSGSRTPDASKSAANLHRSSVQRNAQHKLVSARPSASGMLRTAQSEPPRRPSDVSRSMDPLARKHAAPAPRKQPAVETPAAPVVKTSLKLAPKQAPLVATPQHLQPSAPRATTLNAQKGQTALSKLLASRRAASAPAAQPAQPNTPSPEAQESIRVLQQAAQKVTQTVNSAPASVPRRPQAARRPRGLMQDVVRAPRPARPTAGAAPADSVKHRFRPAPKDYVSEPELQAAAYQPAPAEPQPTAASKPPVEIYGLMDEEPTGKSDEPLGVVEDYQPQGDTVSEGFSEQKIAQGSGKAADNNKYALGGQSPFFLKSVSVEKRPLSDAPTRAKSPAEGSVYQQPSSAPVNKKNVYTKKESKKPLPTKPTVIIPASRRSKAPFIFLLILTVILGAAVGAFIYLCFFQYME